MFDQALFNDEQVEVLSIDGGRRIAAALGNKKFCILRNHGLGPDPPGLRARTAERSVASR